MQMPGSFGANGGFGGGGLGDMSTFTSGSLLNTLRNGQRGGMGGSPFGGNGPLASLGMGMPQPQREKNIHLLHFLISFSLCLLTFKPLCDRLFHNIPSNHTTVLKPKALLREIFECDIVLLNQNNAVSCSCKEKRFSKTTTSFVQSYGRGEQGVVELGIDCFVRYNSDCVVQNSWGQ